MSRYAIIIICLLLAIIAVDIAEHRPDAGLHDSFNIAIGRADLPFQHRLLSPLAALGVAAHSTAGYQTSAAMVCILALTITFAIAYTEAGAIGLLLLFGMLIPSLSLRYVYDSTHPLFIIGLTVAILRRNAWAWLALFAVGTFNRETTIYLFPALALIWWRYGKARTIAVVVASCVIWLATKTVLSHWFGAPSLTADLAALNYQYIVYGVWASEPRSRMQLLYALGGLWICIPLVWQSLDYDHRALLVTLPVAFAFLFVFGNAWEVRTFGDVAPVLAIAIGRSSVFKSHH